MSALEYFLVAGGGAAVGFLIAQLGRPRDQTIAELRAEVLRLEVENHRLKGISPHQNN